MKNNQIKSGTFDHTIREELLVILLKIIRCDFTGVKSNHFYYRFKFQNYYK